MRGAPTLTLSDGEELAMEQPEMVTALVMLWSRDEPDRIGEVALVPGGFTGVKVRMGRGESTPNDTIPRVDWVRQRPGEARITGPFGSPRISRDQLQLEAGTKGTMLVRNIGRCPLLHNGVMVEEARISNGDLLELKGQALMLCLNRMRTIADFAPGTQQPPPHRFGRADRLGLVGESPALWGLRERIQFIAPRTAHVLIRGGSGTGKELVAQAIHALSARGKRPMVARNAATIPESLIDAELFGNARNYPNPGMLERAGLIGEADGSTLFLDEFAEIPPAMQAHLLRVLDAGEYHRLGDSKGRRADFRLIAATNRPESALKEDVLARLRLRLEIPDLNQRREDIPLLIRHLLQRIAKDDPQLATRCFPEGDLDAAPRITPQLVGFLVGRHWSTNIRELEGILWQAISASRGEPLDVYPGLIEGKTPVSHTEPELRPNGVDPMSLTAEELQAALDRNGGRQEPTWRDLGFTSRHVLTRLVKRYGLRVRGRAAETDD